MAKIRTTYLVENEMHGWLGIELYGAGLSSDKVIKELNKQLPLDGETLVLDEVSDDNPFYDEIVESWGVDVY